MTGYAYDADGALWQVTYPSGLRIQYDRNSARGEVVRVVNPTTGTKYADQVAHYPQGPVKSLAFGNGQPLSQSFNLRYEPLSISSGPLALAYTVSPSGDVTQIADTSRTLASCNRNTHRDFGYDFLDRLADSPGWLSYGYDSTGNRTSEAVEGAGASYAYAYDRVIRKDVGGRPKLAFEYDFQTNLSGIGEYDATGTSVTQGVCLRHDPLGRMTLFGWTNAWGIYPDNIGCLYDSNVVTPVARFKYDARNRRIARQDAATGQWTYIVSDPAGNPLSEMQRTEGVWTRVRDYVWLDGRPLAQVEYPGPTPQGEGYAYFFHVDHIGLPRAMTNAAGQLVWNTFPKPYGDIAEKTMTDPLSGRVVVTNLRLPGQYDERLLGSLGLQGPYYNWNRWYLPGVGRYLELDPIALRGGFNRPAAPDWYSYAAANPARFTDPAGLAIWVCNRKSDNGIGNHAYFWDDRKSDSCGRNAFADEAAAGSPSDRGPLVDSCSKVEYSDGKEDSIMDCCKWRANTGPWVPFFNDCHTSIDRCLDGYHNPGVPGGRTGPLCGPAQCK